MYSMIADKYYFIFHNKPRRTKKKKDWKPLAGLTLSNALVELGGFFLIQWPEKDKKILLMK